MERSINDVKDANTFFTELSSASQGPQESPSEFVMSLMSLRANIKRMSEEESSFYDDLLVCNRFTQTICTGLTFCESWGGGYIPWRIFYHNF